MRRKQLREIIPGITEEQLELLDAAYDRDLAALAEALAELRQRNPPEEKHYIRDEPSVFE